ncbi:MAG: hypothetical protein HONBIEJF_02882 [Fimbriimonadaceae bacterium]|nr:hypothetical protein [Fimbriimonadaceae bacterium]
MQALKWVVRLGDRHPERRWIVVALACFAGLAGQLMFRHPVMAAVGFGVVMLSAAEMFLPLRYRIDEQGVSARCGVSETAMAWSDVKRAWVNDEGIKLSPLETPSNMDAFRGVYLRFGDNRDPVLELVRRYWGKDVPVVG